jgi:hypothetical protein
MAPQQKQQISALVEGLMAIRPLKDPRLQSRNRLSAWLVRETAFFYPGVNLVEVVEQVIGPAVDQQYPH